MRLFQAVQRSIYSLDIHISRFLISFFKEKPSLIVLYFHKVFIDKKDLNHDVDLQQGTTIEDFENCINYFLDSGYKFITPDDLLSTLYKDGKYILLTFDDGYANNALVLPVLERYKVPALFFIAVNHVLHNKAYWWDVIFHLKEKGYSSRQINHIKAFCKTKNPKEINQYFTEELKIMDVSPLHESEKPFNKEELRHFSTNPYVFIGNHTMDHAILTACDEEEVFYQINAAQEELKKIINYYPKHISYPNGNFSGKVVAIAQKCGLEVGYSCIRGKNFMPQLNSFKGNYQVKRFIIPKLNSQYKKQLCVFRAPFSVYNTLINLLD
jgi:peptidoglycan/xylan/chitin deacetylase (PgdA/CDA1 family)